MKKKRYLVAILLLLVVPVILGNISWASDADNSYSIYEVIDKALDPDKSAVKEAEWKEDDAREALSAARWALNSVNESVYLEEWYKAYASVQVAEVNLNNAKRAKELNETEITLQVKQAYFNALLDQETVGLTRKKLNQVEEQYRIAKSRYDRNLTPKKEFLSAQVNLAVSQTNMAELERQKDLAYLTLKDLANIDFNQNINLTSKLNYEPLADINTQAVAAKAVEESSSYLQAQDMMEAYQDIKNQSTENSNLASTNTYANADIQVEKWENQMELTKRKVELAVYKAHINLKKAEDKIKTINKQIELAEEVAKIARLSYKAGTGTLLEANDALIKLDETKLEYQKALHAYNTAKASFEANIF